MTVGDHNWALGLRINGRELAPEYRKTVQSVKVLQDLESAGSVTLAVSAPRDEVLAWFDKARVDEGSPIEVEMGTAEHVDLVFAGDITGLEISFGGRLAVSLSLRGYDRRHRLMRSYNPGSHTKVKDSKLVADIARKHGLEVKATATSIEHPYLLQAKQNDHKFLRERAEANGFELFIVGKTLYFRPCAHKDPPALRLSAETDLLEFHASVTSMNQASEVRVGGWDVANKRAIVGTATSATLGRGSGPSRSKSLFGPSLRADGEFPVASQAEAEARANAQLLELALGHLTADATLHGNSAIHPGMVVAIDDVGALRSAQQLRRRHARLRQATVAVSVLSVAVLATGAYTATLGDPRLAAGLVLGGTVVLALVVLKWQPFRRAARSAELAELADAMATNLRLRVRALEEQQDAKARQLEQWKAIVDLTEAVTPA